MNEKELSDRLIDLKYIVDLSTAKYLKNHGFNLPTYYYYVDKKLPFIEPGLKRVKLDKRRMNHNKYDDFIYSAPTLIEAIKWINKHSINLITL